MDREQSELIEGEVLINNDLSDVPATTSAAYSTPARASTGSANGQGKADTIREDIGRTRAAMDATIDRLTARLRPRHLLDDALNLFQGGDSLEDEGQARRTIREAGAMAADKLKQNPIPATLIGAGLAWLLFQDKSRGSKSETSHPSYDPYLDREPGTTETQSHNGHANILAGAKKKHPSSAREADVVATTPSNAIEQLLRSAPLALGVGALAAGLLAGLILPGTKAENELMGEASDELKDTVRETASTLGQGTGTEQSKSPRSDSKVDRMWDL